LIHNFIKSRNPGYGRIFSLSRIFAFYTYFIADYSSSFVRISKINIIKNNEEGEYELAMLQ
jgi:hypothetical protein